MKRIGYIFDKIVDIENIKFAILKSSKGKTKRKSVQKVLKDIDTHALLIQEMLVNKTYVPCEPRIMIRKDSNNKKDRQITLTKYFPDKIIHWCLVLALESVMLKGMYKYNVGNVKGRGIKYGKEYIERFLHNDKSVRYALKLDISKYYHNIDKTILLNQFARKIKCNDTLELLDKVLLTSKGIPIGFYTSQWFANFYLEGLDHFIKEKLKVKYYIRYVDDMLLVGNNKRKMWKDYIKINDYLNKELKLDLKSNYQLFNLGKEHVSMLGFQFFKHKRTRLRKHIFLKIKATLSKLKYNVNKKYIDRLTAYYGWCVYIKNYYITKGDLKLWQIKSDKLTTLLN